MAIFSNANTRAFSHGSRPLLTEIPRASRFHASGELSSQNSPISVWSGVRVLGVMTPSPPRSLISL
jgi:hypothetical protein